MSHPNQLAVPADVLSSAESFELARVWLAHGHNYYLLDVTRFPEPGVWGLLALDLMKHAARAYEQLDGRSREDTYKEILMGFMAEMQNPTEPL